MCVLTGFSNSEICLIRAETSVYRAVNFVPDVLGVAASIWKILDSPLTSFWCFLENLKFENAENLPTIIEHLIQEFCAVRQLVQFKGNFIKIFLYKSPGISLRVIRNIHAAIT